MVGSKIVAAAFIAFSALVEAHGKHAPVDSGLLAQRSIQARACAPQIAAIKQKRAALRKRELELKKRGLRPGIDDTDTIYEIHAPAPKYDYLKNTSLVLLPESTQGPYWLPVSQFLRQDLSRGEAGVPLELDVAVLDVNTCAPLTDALVDLWHCNATGFYSSFTGNNPNIPFEEVLAQQNITVPADGDFRFLQTDNTTFGRGMWPTDANGVTTFRTIFPGFYVQRTIHIHVQVHTHWNVSGNGTLDTSDIVETGQIYFPEDVSAELMALEPYVSHTEVVRYPNQVDGIFLEAEAGGADATADVEPLDGEDFTNGVLGYIVLAVDASNPHRNGSGGSPNGWGVPAVNASGYSEWFATWTTATQNTANPTPWSTAAQITPAAVATPV